MRSTFRTIFIDGVAFEVKAIPVAAVSQSISPGSIASAEAFGSHTLTGGVGSIQPAGIASAEAFGSATITSAAKGNMFLVM